MSKARGTEVGDLARKRQRDAAAQHPVRGKIIGLAVTAAVVAAGAGVVLAANSGAPERSDRADNRAATAPPSATRTEPPLTLTERGTIPKELGELAGFGSEQQPDQNTFAIEDIVVDPPCDVGYRTRASEHIVRLHITVHTGSDTERASMLGRILTPGFFEAIGPDGRRHGAWPGECSEAAGTAWPDEFEPNREYSRTVELRLPVSEGTLILNGVMANAAGWEWRF
ncbi:hypothetical protein [Haloechinothrix salitolerans]|uniref:DUF4352 domain-containing protein n=1 Tax=Haloechinothrix salitolerans TaxID=926830 RepID=A0ABW2BTX9_9PSEU